MNKDKRVHKYIVGGVVDSNNNDDDSQFFFAPHTGHQMKENRRDKFGFGVEHINLFKF